MEEIIVLSLFDGISCGQIALKELGVKVRKYYASEIDKFAIGQTQLNFPNTIQLGSITEWRSWDIEWHKISLILAGSPCQGFSFAGKQLNFQDERSKLFFVFVDILNHVKKLNPDVKFLLENVNMKKEWLRIISEQVGLFGVNINSNLVSAQNRNRWYWINIKTKKVGLFEEIHSNIPQPKDEGILLKDILQPESEVDKKYYIKNPKFGFEGMDIDGKNNALRTGKKNSQSKKHNYNIIKVNPPDKSYCIDANYYKGGNLHQYINKSRRQLVFEPTCVALTEKRTEDAKKQRRKTGTNDFRGKELVPRSDGKVGVLQTGQTNEQIILQLGRGFNKGGEHEEKAPTLTSNSWEQNNLLKQNFRLRRLTPIECAKLQTIPEWYRWKCSDTQIYRMLGNGWTIKVITHILSFLK